MKIYYNWKGPLFLYTFPPDVRTLPTLVEAGAYSNLQNWRDSELLWRYFWNFNRFSHTPFSFSFFFFNNFLGFSKYSLIRIVSNFKEPFQTSGIFAFECKEVVRKFAIFQNFYKIDTLILRIVQIEARFLKRKSFKSKSLHYRKPQIGIES